MAEANVDQLALNRADVIGDDGTVALARAVIDTEVAALMTLGQRLDQAFVSAVNLLLNCKGRIIVTGIGKSGHIGSKIAATFASTGSPAFFVHAAEASHGDIGMMQHGDVVVAISYSGNSNELITLVPGIKRLALPLIVLSGNPTSALAKAAHIVLDISVEKEACPLGLAPTASTTCSLVLGDALAVSLLHNRGFDKHDFARSHPGGRLGRQLLLHVSDVMSMGEDIPQVPHTVPVSDALIEISRKGLGMVAVVNEKAALVGVFTDGDLRRALDQDIDLRAVPISAVMTRGGQSIGPDELAVDAVGKMQQFKITSLPVLLDSRVTGVLTMHALLAAGVV